MTDAAIMTGIDSAKKRRLSSGRGTDIEPSPAVNKFMQKRHSRLVPVFEFREMILILHLSISAVRLQRSRSRTTSPSATSR
jgi:hypothetical protein